MALLDVADVLSVLLEVVRAPGAILLWLFNVFGGKPERKYHELLAWILGILFWMVVGGVVWLVIR